MFAVKLGAMSSVTAMFRQREAEYRSTKSDILFLPSGIMVILVSEANSIA
jgi:hypothetical protein